MTLNDELFAQLGDNGLQQIAGLLGTDTATARQVVEASAGTIVGGMATNAEQTEGAESLRTALDSHVDADPFNGDVATLEKDGQGILGHVLGDQGTEQAAAGISQFAGINSGTIMKLLPMLAPMVMSLLANRASKQNMDAGAVAQDLDQEKSSAMSGGLGDLLNSVLGGAGGGGLGGLLGGLLGGGGGQQQPAAPEPQRQSQSAQGTSNPDW